MIRWWRETAPLPRQLAAIGAMLVALTVAGLATHLPGRTNPGTELRLWLVVGVGAASALLYFAAVFLVLHRPRSARAWAVVLGFAALLRVMLLVSPPFLSGDLYRYIWDGRVQHAGINPYRYVPADPALEGLRDPAIYAGINRAETAPTIYPPMAQLVFWAVAAISQTAYAIKATMLGFDVLAMALVLRLLRRAGLDPACIVIYAWNPVAIWEFSGNGHVDAAAIGFVALALVMRASRLRVATGLALGAAVLVKFLPLVLFPALWRRWDWRMPAAMLVLMIALYGIYIRAGRRVLGFLVGYTTEEGLASGQGVYWLSAASHFAALPDQAGTVWFAAGLVALGALSLWMMFGPRPADDIVAVARRAMVMATALMVVMTPHYPWYFAWLALPACLAPCASVIYLAGIAFIQYIGRYSDRILIPTLIYVPFVILAIRDLRPHRAPIGAEARSL